MKLASAYVAVALTVLAASNLADAHSGNDILEDCEILFKEPSGDTNDAMSSAHCAGIVAGYNDMAQLLQGHFGQQIYCVPEKGLETGQVIRVFIKWLKENPEALHESSRSLFIVSMREAFPCPM